MKEITCKICAGTASHRCYTAKEMMFGKRDLFTYFLCDYCGCLQLLSVPANLADYYPDNYYSFASAPPVISGNLLKQWLYNAWITYLLTGKSALGKIVAKLRPSDTPVFHIFRKAGFTKTKKILDVGSGNGWLLHPMVNAGFQKIKGIDPFIAHTFQYDNGLEILKVDLLDFSDKDWDIIMFNHSFEHLATPLNYLKKAHQLLKENGICLLRLPTVSSGAWETYKENWAQLDAPRHLFLHSIQSLSILAASAGFTITEIFQETTLFPIIASEQYLRDIPVYGDKQSYYEGNKSLFSVEEIEAFRIQLLKWEQEGRADSIALILKKENR